MTRLVFAAFLFGLIFLSLCKGQLSLPPGGDTFYVLPGQNVTLAWKLNVSGNIFVRTWTLLPNINSFAQIGTDGKVTKASQHSPGPFSIKKPSTLILENVDIQYNGTYKFLVVAAMQYSSYVTVIVKGQLFLPPGGDTFYVLPGQNVTLAWKLNVPESDILARTWTFLPNSNSFAQLATDGTLTKRSQYSPGPFSIKRPSTLILENVNIQYNGTYKFFVIGSDQYSSYVTVIVEDYQVTS